MRALLQRVTQASVTVEGQTVGSIGPGLLVFLGVGQGDSEDDARYVVEKVSNLRIFADPEGRFNLSVLDVGGQVLLVSQFTLYADTRRGRRPSFTGAAPPQEAEALCDRVAGLFRAAGLHMETGRFQAHMLVQLANDGPVTIFIDSAERHQPRNG
ncbi:MAG: D-tyrosyl-tRNA(Tyr) deacylase [Chloroflexi bacterium]|nr:D-tyrosyl-tRNA(Tyr) deacylase [Chloroflexota bacterium]